MKSIYSIFIFILSVVAAAFAGTSDNHFPAYDPAMEIEFGAHVSCNCSGTFGGSASATCVNTQNCSCTSGLLSCECHCSSPSTSSVEDRKEANDHIVSVTPEQYEKWKELAAILQNENSTASINAYKELAAQFELLKAKNYAAYHANAAKVVSALKAQSSDVRAKINTTFGIEIEKMTI